MDRRAKQKALVQECLGVRMLALGEQDFRKYVAVWLVNLLDRIEGSDEEDEVPLV